MGACYGKGSGRHDPDKAPYERTENDGKRRTKNEKKIRSGTEADTFVDERPVDAEPKNNGTDQRSPPTADDDEQLATADGHQSEADTSQLPKSRAAPETLNEDTSGNVHVKHDTSVSTQARVEKAISVKPKEDVSSRRHQLSVTPERVEPRVDISAPALTGAEPVKDDVRETSNVKPTSNAEEPRNVTHEEVVVEIVEQTKLKQESAWTGTSKSPTTFKNSTDAQPAKRVSPLNSPVEIGVGETPATKNNEILPKATVSSLRKDEGTQSKTIIINCRRNTTEVKNEPEIRECFQTKVSEIQKTHALKTETIVIRETVKESKAFESVDKRKEPATKVDDSAVYNGHATDDKEKKTSSKSDENVSSPSQCYAITSSDVASVNSVERQQNEFDKVAPTDEKTKVTVETTASTAATTVNEKCEKHGAVENGLQSSNTADDCHDRDQLERVTDKSKVDDRRTSVEGKSVELIADSVQSNIPSPTSQGSVRGQRKERMTSASSMKYTPASSLRRTSGASATTSVSKLKEIPLRHSTNEETKRPTTRLAEDILSLLSDFTDELQGVLAKYEFCQNTRTRLMNCIQKWITGEETEKENTKRVWLLTGQAGMGKSSVAAEVYRRQNNDCRVAHFFRHSHPNPDYNDARFVLQSLARQFCAAIPGYGAVLTGYAELEEALRGSSLSETFEALVSRPLLSNELSRIAADRVLVVIDAVDECSPETRQQFVKLIDSFADKTPDWMHVLVTSRNENHILSQLENARTVELKQSSDNLNDIKRFLRRPMAQRMDRISMDGGLTQLVKKTDGSFLCAKVFAGMLDQLPAERTIALREVDGMFPKGITNCYSAVFRTFKDELGKLVSPNELNDKYQSITGLLCRALEPIPIDILVDIIKVDRRCLDSLNPVLDIADGMFTLLNRHVAEWLENEQEAGDLRVNVPASQKRLANWCLVALSHIRDRSESTCSAAVQRYALKHAIWHLVEVPKQQDNIAGLLCDLRYISERLRVPGHRVRHLIHDYQHWHYAGLDGGRKLFSMSEYMKKHPKLTQQMAAYEKFVRSEAKNLDENPDLALQIAANYPNCERIRQNALVELEGKPWLEDKTNVADTHHTAISQSRFVVDADLSSDGKTLAMIVSDQSTESLVLFHSSTGDKKLADIDMKTLPDRYGSLVVFLPDDGAVFVGSLTTFVNARQGTQIASGVDVKSVEMKEKYVVESVAVSKRFLACGLSTLPTGGRSLHLAVLDLKLKKFTRNIEVLKFRFGGSTQFGIKSCALSQDEILICSLVKESHKAQFVCTVWSMAKGTNLYKVNVCGENLAKCLFLGNESLLVGSGLRSCAHSAAVQTMERTKLWNFKAGQQLSDWDERELFSVFCTQGAACISLKWFFKGSRAYLEMRKVKGSSAELTEKYRIDGLSHARDIMAASGRLIVMTKDDIRLYTICDLTRMSGERREEFTVADIRITNLAIHPRREDLLIAHVSPGSQTNNVSFLDLLSDEMVLTASPIKQLTGNNKKERSATKVFRGRVANNDWCQYSSDGSFVIVNNGKSVDVLNIGNNNSDSLTSVDNAEEPAELQCVASQKDNIVGVVDPSKPDTVQVFDLKSRHAIRQFSLAGGSEAAPADFAFMPYNGYLVVYYRLSGGTLAIWNPRNGELIHRQDELDVSYARLSPASDRLAISTSGDQSGGQLMLRNSDGKVCMALKTPDRWRPSAEAGDVEFVTDGTALVGVVAEANACRIWNAGNGDVLRDWRVDLRRPVEIVGTITNAHVLLHDGRLIVVDMVTGQIVTSLSLAENLVRKNDPLGIRISAKGNTVVGSTESGQLKIIRCHGYGAVKRKSTLQIMKSNK